VKAFLKRSVALLCVLLTLAIALGGCGIVEDSEKGEALCREFMDYVVKDNQYSAYGMMEDICTREEFLSLWDVMYPVFENTQSYELTQTGWHYDIEDGIDVTTLTFEMKTDDGKSCQLQIMLDDNGELYGFWFLDTTEFEESVSYTIPLNIVFLVLSLLAIAFAIWMIVDCARSKIRYKVLWILLILAAVSISVTYGEMPGLEWSLGLALGFSSITAIPIQLSVCVKLVLPVGAIVYFCLRNHLKRKSMSPYPPTPPYGQPPYGQMPYGQPMQGQPPYGQMPYGQTPYGQPMQGQMPYGQAPTAQTPSAQQPSEQQAPVQQPSASTEPPAPTEPPAEPPSEKQDTPDA